MVSSGRGGTREGRRTHAIPFAQMQTGEQTGCACCCCAACHCRVRLQRIAEMHQQHQRKRKAGSASEDLHEGGEAPAAAGEPQQGEQQGEELPEGAATATAELLGLAVGMPDGLGGVRLPKKPRRTLQDTLRELQQAGGAEGSSDEEDGGDEDDGLLDWRAKGV